MSSHLLLATSNPSRLSASDTIIPTHPSPTTANPTADPSSPPRNISYIPDEIPPSPVFSTVKSIVLSHSNPSRWPIQARARARGPSSPGPATRLYHPPRPPSPVAVAVPSANQAGGAAREQHGRRHRHAGARDADESATKTETRGNGKEGRHPMTFCSGPSENRRGVRLRLRE